MGGEKARRRMAFQERKNDWFEYAKRLSDTALEIIGQCDGLDTMKGAKDPKVIALTLLTRSLCHLRR
jgi:hypothetical protein